MGSFNWNVTKFILMLWSQLLVLDWLVSTDCMKDKPLEEFGLLYVRCGYQSVRISEAVCYVPSCRYLSPASGMLTQVIITPVVTDFALAASFCLCFFPPLLCQITHSLPKDA